ncbi:MAG: hypothetical protein JNK10_07175 [Cyclobacteriaceae bacterium]|nr:hypothetical protein [Cyclobacteriaceae bacterium]
MKDDNMEKFFSDNRSAFDDRTPSDRVWNLIERTLFGGTHIGVWNSVTIWRAAAVVLLGLCVYQFVAPRLGPQVLDRLSQQEFRDVESFYAAQISEKVSLIRNDESFTDDQFTQDFEKLEAMYAVLAEELKRHPSQKVKDALVLNMLVRIDLLNQLLQQQEELKQKKNLPTEV